MKKLLSLSALLLFSIYSKAQIITTFAGYDTSTASCSGYGGPALSANFSVLWGMCRDAAGNIYIADQLCMFIFKIDTAGTLTIFAGTGGSYSGDGGPATAAGIGYVSGICLDRAGNLYFGDGISRVRKINTSGIISTIAGNGVPGYTGTGIPATIASLDEPYGVYADTSGNVFIRDNGDAHIQEVKPTGYIYTIAGIGSGTGTAGYSGDGGPATAAEIYGAYSIHSGSFAVGNITEDTIGNIIFADGPRIRAISPSGIISTLFGSGTWGDSGDGGPATTAKMSPVFVHLDSAGNLYFSDYGSRLRKINTSGIVNTAAGNGLPGFGGDGSPATTAYLDFPLDFHIDSNGDIYINAGLRVRKICMPPDTAIVSGSDSVVCVGGSLPLTASLTGGVWSTATSHAYVSPTGVVSGISAGLDTVIYTLTNSCYFTATRYAVRVKPLPVAGGITGATPVCPGVADTLADTVMGGVWSSAATTVAIVGSAGIAYSIAAGTDTITYTVTTSCGTAVADFTLTVISPPVLSPISGADTLCSGSSATYTDTATGGVWSVGVSGIATVGSASGSVTVTGTGTDTVYYTVTNMCGPSVAAHSIQSVVLPVISAIRGAATLCIDSTETLTDSTSGGVWASGTAIATVNTAGGLIAVSAGRDTVFYTVTNVCGPVVAYDVITVENCDTLEGVAPLQAGNGKLIITPNPSDGAVSMQLLYPANGDASIVITDVLGKVVKAFELSANKERSVRLGVSAGVYIVTATIGADKFTTKMVVE